MNALEHDFNKTLAAVEDLASHAGQISDQVGLAKSKAEDGKLAEQLLMVEAIASRISIKAEVAFHAVRQIQEEAEQMLAEYGIDLGKASPNITDEELRTFLADAEEGEASGPGGDDGDGK